MSELFGVYGQQNSSGNKKVAWANFHTHPSNFNLKCFKPCTTAF